MFNLWKPLIPAGVEGTWAPVQGTGADRLVLQRPLPVARHGDLRADHRPLVLVHGPIHRPARAGAPNETEARRGSIFAAFLKLFPPYLFIIPGLICYALAKSGRNAGLADALFGPHADPERDRRAPSR